MNCAVSSLLSQLSLIILLIKTQTPDNNKSGSDSNQQASNNQSITPSNSTNKRDSSIPLFETDDKQSLIPPIFNVLLRLDNSFIEYFKKIEKKDDPIVKILLELNKKVLNSEKYPISIYKEEKNLLDILCNNYQDRFNIHYLFPFFNSFLSLIVDSNFDEEINHFRIELDNNYLKIPESDRQHIFKYNRGNPLSLLINSALKIDETHMSFDFELDKSIINRPKLIFFYLPDGEINFNKDRNRHFTVKRTNGDVYNLRGIVYFDTDHYNSFFIHNGELYNQETGKTHSLTTAEINFLELLIFELQESK
ncbi:hypothetical protein M153_5130002498 [Pseudoloma neurophilia]|uniref:Uncharacterized protein n=1 Tax=Pseudoloma neurophilia TaxID=146866 RepID=A0A0R0M604_9MICR|nr:hypothetical protein M153_5130002498 [Pseudoloma neurophilia]